MPNDEWQTFGPPDWKPKRLSFLRRRWKALAGYTILFLLLVARDFTLERMALSERAHQATDTNELRALVRANSDAPTDAPIVLPMDLVRTYHERPKIAEKAYTGKRIAVQIRQYVIRGREIHWHLGDVNLPALLVFECDDVPEPAAILWVTGTCEGITKDGGRREFGYDFHIRVSGCRTKGP